MEIQEKDLSKLILWGVIGILFIILVGSSFYIISAGQRGVLLTFGKPSMESKGEGLHFKIPLVQTVKKMEVRTTKLEETGDSASKDLQDVQTTIALNYHISLEQTPLLYQEIGLAYVDRIIKPIIQEELKSVTAKFTAEELVTRRSEVRSQMKEELRERLESSYIIVDDFNIVNFQFSESFDEAIEQKVTAEQLKLKAQMDLERIKIEASQKVARAEAEAEALRLQKQQITPDLIKLREIEAKIMAIEKWDGKLPIVTGGAMPLVELSTLQSQTE